MKQKIHYLFMLLLMLLTGVGGVKAQEILTEGFEKKEPGTNYQRTVTVSSDESDCGIGWEIYYGNVSTSSKITGNNSAALRLYTSSNYGYIKSTTPVEGLSKVDFNAKAATSNDAKIKINVSYSTDGNSWISLETDKALTSSAAVYSYKIPSGGKFFQIAISIQSTKPSKSSAQLTIDDVVFTYSDLGKENVDLSFGEISSQTVGVGKSVKIEATATPSVPISYSSSDETIAKVSKDGTVEGKKPGKATIKASFAGNDQYNSASDEYELTVIPSELGGDVTEETITINEPYGNSGNNAIILYDKGTNGQNGPFYYNNSELRLYCGNTLTVSSESKKIAKIEFDLVINKNSSNTIPKSITCTSGSCEDFNKLSTSLTSAVWNAPTKNGVSEVTFTINGDAGNVGFKSAKVYYVLKSFDVAPASNNESYGTVSFEEGVITATPAEGYRVSLTNPYEVTPAEAATVVQDGNDFTVTATADCTVQINFEAIPTHTATFSVNGTETSMSFAEGSPITFDTPDDVQGKKFVGWTTAAIDGTTGECPGLVTLGTMGNADVKYYAVFANGNVTITPAKYTLDYANETGLAGSTEWGSYGKAYAYTASDGGNWTVKAYKNGGMQINSGKDASIKIPECAGDIASIEIVGSTANAVGLSESDYSGSGTITYIVEGTDAKEQTLDLSGKAVRTGYIVPKSGSIVITKVVVNYSKTEGTYSDYCTTVVAPVKPAKPIVFHDGGEGVTYEGELTVPMFAEEGATIYYTTDGSEPKVQNAEQAYSGPVSLPVGKTTVKAIAVKNGMASDVVEKVYTIVPVQAPDIVDLDGYYSIQNKGNGKYVNVAGRKTVTFVDDNTDKAGTVIKVKTTNGEVDVLRSQGVDVPGYAERAMNYVDDIISLAVEKLELQNLLGSTGEQTILEKFHDAFDYHLHLEQPAENKYRIYGKTPSMKHVVDFYAENKDKVDAKLPMMEERINYAINKVLEKVGRGLSLKDQFNIHRIWDDMNVEGLTEPVEGDDAAIARFYEEVLSSEAKVWLFAYEAAMYYVNFVEGKESFLELKAQYPEYFKYWDKAKRVLPDFKYYIVSNTEGNGIDFISEGNEDIKNNAERTIWTLEQREKFKVSLGVKTTKTVYPVSQDGRVESYTEFYTTLNTDFAYTLPKDVTAYQITGVGEVKDNETMGTVLKQAITGTIPAQTPVLLMAKEKNTAELQLAADASALSGNELYGNEYLIEKDQLKHTMMKTVFETIKKNFGDELYDRYVAEYEHLMLLNSGTVNNKYFFNLSKANDLVESGSYNVGKVMVLGQDDDLGIRFHYANKEDLIGNEAFMFDDTNKLEDIVLTLRGDINRDGIVSIADVTAVVNIILGKAKYPDDADKYDFEAANVNGDQVISIADVTALVNIILGKDKAN